MNAELVKSESAAREADEPRSLMQVIAQAVMAGTTSVEVMRELLDMQFKVENRQAEVEFNAALARLMPKLPRVEKNGTIRDGKGQIRSTWARYEDIDLVIRPLLAEEGFSISFDTDDSKAGQICVIGTLAHRMGHSRSSKVTLPANSGPPGTTGCQAVGSTVSYGKRYVVTSMLNIISVGEDDDGQGGAEPISEDQALTLRTLLQDTKSDVTKFLAWAGVAKVEDILEKNFSSVVKALESKRRQ